jgi:hypothetical protein
MSKAETIRLEEYTGLIQNKLVVAWQSPDAVSPWLPTEFLMSQYITRILVTGRASALSVALTADSGWTQIWRSPGSKEWSCLLSVVSHMPGPILFVIGPDMMLTPKLVTNLQAIRKDTPTTVVVLRSPGAIGWISGSGPEGTPDQVFFPVLDARNTGALLPLVQDCKAAPRTLDVKALLPQLAAAGYGLTVSEGVLHWYNPADSAPMSVLSVAQIARQLQVLGIVLEKTII